MCFLHSTNDDNDERYGGIKMIVMNVNAEENV